MSVAAVGWAFRQKIPLNAKCILLALADQTDERTGRVCYGRTDIKYLAEKCAISVRSLWRYVGALCLNGYVRRESGKLEGKSSTFWLCLDRGVAESLDEWQWTAPQAADPEPQDVDEIEGGAQSVAQDEVPEDATETVTPGVQRHGAPRLSGITKEHPRAREIALRGFDRKAQDLERGIGTKATPEESKVFVIEGTRAWDAWCAHNRSIGRVGSFPTCWGIGKHAGKRGWHFDSLFPPSTAPPRELESELADFK